MGSGGGAGKASFTDIVAEARTGRGTLSLFRSLASGKHLTQVQIIGCETDTCTSKMVLDDVLVTSLTLGSPTLFDDVQLNYAKITWERDDSKTSVPRTKTFSWDIVTNSAG